MAQRVCGVAFGIVERETLVHVIERTGVVAEMKPRRRQDSMRFDEPGASIGARRHVQELFGDGVRAGEIGALKGEEPQAAQHTKRLHRLLDIA